jgi:acid phosphatase class B
MGWNAFFNPASGIGFHVRGDMLYAITAESEGFTNTFSKYFVNLYQIDPLKGIIVKSQRLEDYSGNKSILDPRFTFWREKRIYSLFVYHKDNRALFVNTSY